ncbi:MAG: LysR substrate-binding domain-containing protein [Pseudomonadota bacterium]
MLNLIRRIQSPSALFAFEAAARHLSFTRAAAELNVSQPAISLSVKKIETALGAQLFERRHRAIALTEIGERFYADVSFGLMHILRSAEGIAIQRGGHHVTLSCSTGFGHFWMMPRMAGFQAQFPHIDLRLQTTDRDVDLTGDDVSIAIRRGAGQWDGYDSFLLAEEHIDPVCSPTHLEGTEPPKDAGALAAGRLIHLEEPFRLRPKWADWFAAHGVAYRDRGDGLRLNDYALVLQAAIAGEGIAMGWRHLTDSLVENGLLLRLFDGAYDVGQGMYVIWPKTRPLTPQALQFLDWLRQQAQAPTAGR